MLILEGHRGAVLSVAYSPDGTTLVSGGADRSVRLWELPGGRMTAFLVDSGGPVTSLAWSLDGRFLAVGTHQHVAVHEVASGDRIAVVSGRYGGTYVAAFSDDSSVVVLAGYLDPELTVFRLGHIGESPSLTGHHGGVLSISIGGNLLASGGGLPNSGELLSWDVKTGLLVRRFEDEEREIRVETGYTPWRTRTEARILRSAHATSVFATAVSRDGRRVASGSKDRTVKLWKVDEERPSAILRGHSATVTALSFTPDAQTLLSADESGEVRLWDTTSGTIRHRLNWGIGGLRSVVFAHDGMTAAAGGARDVLVWDIDEIG